MIDSLVLVSHIAKVDKSSFNKRLSKNKNGELVSKKYFLNLPDDKNSLITIEQGEKFDRGNSLGLGSVVVRFSVPKLLTGGDNVSVDPGEYKFLKDKLMDNLKGLVYFPDGLELEQFDLGRVDLYKNIKGYDSTSFIGAIKSLGFKGKYQQRDYKRGVFSGKTYLLYNSLREFTLYDKRAEVKEKRKIDIGEDIIRAELRFRKKKEVKESLGISYFGVLQEKLVNDLAFFQRKFNDFVSKIIPFPGLNLAIVPAVFGANGFNLSDFCIGLVSHYLGKAEMIEFLESAAKAYGKGRKWVYRNKSKVNRCYDNYASFIDREFPGQIQEYYQQLFYEIA